MSATIKHIYIAKTAGAALQTLSCANLVAGQGIQGDRYFNQQGSFSASQKHDPSTELTLIEQEQIDHFNKQYKRRYAYADFRRNIITEGIELNALVGKTFTLGKIRLKGIMLCEPCAQLAETLDPLVLPQLLNKGGLRAQILSSGEIKLAEPIRIDSDEPL